MARLIAVLGKVNGQSEPAVVEWVNPDHVSAVRREVVGTEPRVELYVSLKVSGMPLTRSWFGAFSTAAEAESRWEAFLAEIAPAD
ncbi:hypothetical protein [Leifsonia sp. Leaf264]|uniref:hypothetical protein n=1 Tax=Leifsonia sp. Leaf264 TaxID=1736314 RepID=UPI0006FF8305|nr:hypothetical protein [Leifsonia sp. Leaf264]KQO98727.1 hypothetical protein ASF30_11740 [Leifsonia sp. Leaf264]